MDSEIRQPIAGKAREGGSSRKCPYCRTSFAGGEETLTCSACSAVHHSECWGENGGCAVWGCEARPKTEADSSDESRASVSSATPAREPSLPPVATSGPGSSPPSGKPKGKTQRWDTAEQEGGTQERAGAALAGQVRPVHVLVGLGILSATLLAVVVLVFSGNETNAPDLDPPPSGQGVSPSPPTKPVPTTVGFPPTPIESQRQAIERMFTEWHNAADRGDRDTMWRLLSNRKKSQINRGVYGATDSDGNLYADYDNRREWEEVQASLAGDLDTAGVRVDLIGPSYSQDRVRTIRVKGMTQRSTGCEWDGITWVRFDGQQWLYEPGYLVTPERRDDWAVANERDELLGAQCQ